MDCCRRSRSHDGIVAVTAPVAGYACVVSFTFLATGLAAGTHTFKLQWKTGAATATMYAGAGTPNLDVHPQFWAREV